MARPVLAPVPMLIAVVVVFGWRANMPVVLLIAIEPVSVILLACSDRFVIELLPNPPLATVMPEAFPETTDRLCTALPMLAA